MGAGSECRFHLSISVCIPIPPSQLGHRKPTASGRQTLGGRPEAHTLPEEPKNVNVKSGFGLELVTDR